MQRLKIKFDLVGSERLNGVSIGCFQGVVKDACGVGSGAGAAHQKRRGER